MKLKTETETETLLKELKTRQEPNKKTEENSNEYETGWKNDSEIKTFNWVCQCLSSAGVLAGMSCLRTQVFRSRFFGLAPVKLHVFTTTKKPKDHHAWYHDYRARACCSHHQQKVKLKKTFLHVADMHSIIVVLSSMGKLNLITFLI